MLVQDDKDLRFEDNADLEQWNKLRQGDHRAYESIYRNHIELIFNYGKKICGDEQLVEDCIHDLFVEIWNKRKQLMITSSVKFYLLKSIRRKILKQLKKDQRSVEFNDFDVAKELSFEEKVALDESAADKEARLRLALRSLTPRQKEVIHLKFYCNFKYEQIAEIMHISVEAVYNLIHRSISYP